MANQISFFLWVSALLCKSLYLCVFCCFSYSLSWGDFLWSGLWLFLSKSPLLLYSLSLAPYVFESPLLDLTDILWSSDPISLFTFFLSLFLICSQVHFVSVLRISLSSFISISALFLSAFSTSPSLSVSIIFFLFFFCYLYPSLPLPLSASLSPLSPFHPHVNPACTHPGISKAPPPDTEPPPWFVPQYSASPSQRPSWWSQRITIDSSKTFHWQNLDLMMGCGGKVEKTHGMFPPSLHNPHPRPPLTCSLEDRVSDGDVPSARERLGLIHQGLPHHLVPLQDDSRPRPQVDGRHPCISPAAVGAESRSHSLTQEKALHLTPGPHLPGSLPCRLQPHQGRAETRTLWSPPSLTYITWPQALSSLGFSKSPPSFGFKNYRDSYIQAIEWLSINLSQPTQDLSSKSQVYQNLSLKGTLLYCWL